MPLNPQKPLEERLQNILQVLDELTDFNFYKVNVKPHPNGTPTEESINGCINIIQFRERIENRLLRISSFLKYVINVKNTNKRLQYIEEVHSRIQDLSFEKEKMKEYIQMAENDLQRKIDSGELNEDYEISDFRFSNWTQYLGEAAKEYMNIKPRLEKMMQVKLETGGFEFSPDGKITPIDPKSLPKRWFSSKLTAKEFAYFIQLCIDTKIIKPIPGDKRFNSSRKDVARMIAENFQTHQGKHFSARSFYEDMKNPIGDFSKNEVKEVINKMLLKIS